MPYQALYRKYRPSNFDEVVGQRAIIQTLKNAKAQDRIAHAYLFCGPRGTGKTSIAKIFARMLNCTSTNHDQPCGHCENCQMALNGSHPDIIEIDAASNNGVEEVRNLIDRVKYAPMQGQFKVYIIDEVHMMSKGAFNALLKTIEEPPKHIVFIFATTEPNKVLPTIISRCQRFDFSKVAMADIEKRLHIVCESEKIAIDDQAISLIASLSDGGMRDALSILDQCVAYCSSEIHIDDVRNIYGVITSEDIGRLFQYLYHKNLNELMMELQHISDQGMDLSRFTSDFISLLKNSIIYEYSPTTTLIDDSVKKVIQDFFIEAPMVFRMNVLDNLMDTFNKFRFASNVLDYLEAGLLKTVTCSYEQESMKTNEKSEETISSKTEKSCDFVDEKSDISEKSTNTAHKQGKVNEETVSDVSRETFEKSEKADRKIILDDEMVLSLMVGANRKEREDDSKKYEKISEFTYDLSFMRPANLLKEANIVASGSNYILIAVSMEVLAKEINEYENEEGFEELLEQVLGKEKKIFAIDQLQRKRCIELFKERRINHSLPQAAVVECRKKTIDEEQEEDNPIKKLFPNVEIRED